MFSWSLHLKGCFRHKYHFTEMFPPFNFLTQYISSFCYVHIAYHGSWHIADIQRMLAEFIKEYYRLDINLNHLQQNRAWVGGGEGGNHIKGSAFLSLIGLLARRYRGASKSFFRRANFATSYLEKLLTRSSLPL